MENVGEFPVAFPHRTFSIDGENIGQIGYYLGLVGALIFTHTHQQQQHVQIFRNKKRSFMEKHKIFCLCDCMYVCVLYTQQNRIPE
jgi:hypothetical protein